MKSMNKTKIGKMLLAACLMSASLLQAQVVETIPAGASRHLHVYSSKDSKLFLTWPFEEVASLRFDPASGKMIVSHKSAGDIGLEMAGISKTVIGHSVPRIDINTVNTLPGNEIQSKTDYVDAVISIEGCGIYDDFEPMKVSVRGRGNTTWGMPKKPYRLKFAKKQSLLGFKKAKNYVLLANYMDCSLMRNYVAMQFAQMIGTDYPNHMLPVDVYLNGEYKGSYMLTEKVGINSGSIAMSDEDEAASILFEIDANTPDDDEYPFTDLSFGLPFRVKDPDAPEDPAERKKWLADWRADLNMMMAAVKTLNNPWSYIDLDSFVKYVMTFNFCTNQELKHPKSVYLYKTKGGKYRFGPVWDFDWAFGFDCGGAGTSYSLPLLTTGAGAEFFLRLMKTPVFLSRYAEIWKDFYDSHREEFFRKFDDYASFLEPSAAHDKVILRRDSYYHSYLNDPRELRRWLENHIEWINDPARNYGLF